MPQHERVLGAPVCGLEVINVRFADEPEAALGHRPD
jgi:hypothetical protein